MSNGFKIADNKSRRSTSSGKVPDTRTNVTLNPAFGKRKVNKSVIKGKQSDPLFCANVSSFFQKKALFFYSSLGASSGEAPFKWKCRHGPPPPPPQLQAFTLPSDKMRF